MAKVTDLTAALAEPIVQEQGCSLWDVEYVREAGQWFLRVYIDKEGGVSIQDCEAVSRPLSDALDEADPIEGSYVLEVSSPGLNRKLTRPEHFEAYMDEPVRVRLIRPLEECTRELEGLLIGYEDGKLELQLDEETGVTLEKKELAWVCALDDIDL